MFGFFFFQICVRFFDKLRKKKIAHNISPPPFRLNTEIFFEDVLSLFDVQEVIFLIFVVVFLVVLKKRQYSRQ